MNIVLDIGTSGIKVLCFDEKDEVVYRAYESLPKREEGTIVEQDPEEMFNLSRDLVSKAITELGEQNEFVLGITTQRETVVAFHKQTGRSLHSAISWQDERTHKEAEEYAQKYGKLVREKTGLPILPYFSATKMSWLLEQDVVKDVYESGDLYLGTLDAWIICKFTGNFYTDVTNASRTLLYNIHEDTWDEELCEIFSVPIDVLPKVLPSKNDFGTVDINGVSMTVGALAGDQQSSLFAAGEEKGVTKITFGSGVFIMQVIDETSLDIQDFFVTRTCSNKNKLCIEQKVMRLAEYVTPLLEKSKSEELVRLLDDVVEKVTPLVETLPVQPGEIIVDGGVTQSDYLLKKLEEHISIPIKKQVTYDGTALGIHRLLFE